MKKTVIILSVYCMIISLVVYSCGTKNDPAVPNHTTNISTNSNTVSFVTSDGTYNFNFGFFNCGDTSLERHYSMSAKDISSQFIVSVIFYDSIAPAAVSSFSIVNPITTSTLSAQQCFIKISAPTLASSQFVATSGIVNYDPNNGNPKVYIQNIPIINTTDSTKTATITGMWNCQ